MASHISKLKLSWVLFGVLIGCNVLFWYGFNADQSRDRCVEIIAKDLKKTQEYKILLQQLLDSMEGERNEF